MNNSNVIVLSSHGLSSKEKLTPIIEAFLFSQKELISFKKLAEMLNCSEQLVKESVSELRSKLKNNFSGLMISQTGRKIELVPKSEYQSELIQMKNNNDESLTAIVEEFLYVLESRGNRDGTIKSYRINLVNFIKFIGKSIDEIYIKDIRYYLMNEKKKGNSRNTISTKVSIIKSFFGWLMDEEFIKKDPTRKLESPKINKKDFKYLTHEEVEMLKENCGSLRERVIIEVLYTSGLRVSELISLDWHNIDFNNKIISVIEGKGGKDRFTLLSTKAVMLLKKYHDKREGEKDWVFQTKFRGLNRMSTKTVQRIVKSLGGKSEIKKKVTPHRLRHSFATHLLEGGVSIDKVQILLGHESVATTQIYAKTNKTEIEYSYRKVFH